jgi:glucans biosynthesis protein C
MQLSNSPRLYFLDWLRIIALCLLMVYHTGMLYVPWGFHVKSEYVTAALIPWMKLTEPWRMSLIFMISGAATALMLRKLAGWSFVRERARYLLLPLVCGIVLIVPPQSYFEVIQKHAYQGSYLDFLALYFTHYKGFCEKNACLILPTWNHLWFLPYLFLYSVILAVFVAYRPSALARVAEKIESKSASMHSWLILLLVPMAVLFGLRLSLWARFPSTHALLDDVFNHAVYGCMFAAGAIFASGSLLWSRVKGLRLAAYVLAISFWAILVFIKPAKPLEHGVIAIFQWSALMALLGFAYTHLNFDSAWRAKLSQAVFPVYIFHQTILIASSQWLAPWHLGAALESSTILLLTVCGSYALYLLCRRVSFLQMWVGIKPLRA